MVKTKEEIREYKKNWRKANREKIRGYHKKYYKVNKEKLKIDAKKYQENNREKIIELKKKYREKYHMKHTIHKWKKRGLIVDDECEYEGIYYLVMSTENCELCNCILTDNKPKTSTSRVMDHDHFTGKFRAVLCRSCNSRQPKQPIKL